MSKKLVLGLGLLVGSLSLAPASVSADASGTWKTQTGKTGGSAIVRVYKCGSSYCGKITKVIGNSNKSSVGKTIVKGMKKSGKNYKGGTVYAPDTKKTYKGKMQEIGSSKLKVSGCVAGGLFCRSQTWTRQ
ncbi:MAG: DUF2147 domain-containing protein [Alphaproteobacteria bacterium]